MRIYQKNKKYFSKFNNYYKISNCLSKNKIVKKKMKKIKKLLLQKNL